MTVTAPSDPPDHWFPTLGGAQAVLPSPMIAGGLLRRDIALWTITPIGQRPLAAVIVKSIAFVRERWRVRTEFSEAALAAIRDEPAPDDALVAREVRYRRLCGPASAPRQCLNCLEKRGRIPCKSCDGSGTVWDDQAGYGMSPSKPCPGCEHGWALCGACDGTGVCVDAEIEYTNDTVNTQRRVFLPDVAPDLAAPLEMGLRAERQPPDALRVKLSQLLSVPPEEVVEEVEPLLANTPYRTSGAAREGYLRGHSFGNAAHVASHALAVTRKARDVRALQASVWVWPFLELRYRVRDVDHFLALWSAAEGGPHLALSRPVGAP